IAQIRRWNRLRSPGPSPAAAKAGRASNNRKTKPPNSAISAAKWIVRTTISSADGIAFLARPAYPEIARYCLRGDREFVLTVRYVAVNRGHAPDHLVGAGRQLRQRHVHQFWIGTDTGVVPVDLLALGILDPQCAERRFEILGKGHLYLRRGGAQRAADAGNRSVGKRMGLRAARPSEQRGNDQHYAAHDAASPSVVAAKRRSATRRGPPRSRRGWICAAPAIFPGTGPSLDHTPPARGRMIRGHDASQQQIAFC